MFAGSKYPKSDLIQKLCRGGLLLLAYGLSRWGEWTWEFVAVLLLLAISMQQQQAGKQPNLVLVASYGLLLSVFRIACRSVVGSALDRMPLAQGPLTFLVLQNLLVSASASCLAAALAFSLTGCVQVFLFQSIYQSCHPFQRTLIQCFCFQIKSNVFLDT